MQVFIFFAIIALIVLIAGHNAFKNEPKVTEDVSSGIEVDEVVNIKEPIVPTKKTSTKPPISKPKNA